MEEKSQKDQGGTKTNKAFRFMDNLFDISIQAGKTNSRCFTVNERDSRITAAASLRFIFPEVL